MIAYCTVIGYRYYCDYPDSILLIISFIIFFAIFIMAIFCLPIHILHPNARSHLRRCQLSGSPIICYYGRPVNFSALHIYSTVSMGDLSTFLLSIYILPYQSATCQLGLSGLIPKPETQKLFLTAIY